MAKSKSIRRRAVPASTRSARPAAEAGSRPNALKQLDELQDDLSGAKCSLHCVVHTLDMSAAVDGCEDAARARSVAHRVLDVLDTLDNRLDEILVSLANRGTPPDPQVVAIREVQS